jgi:PHD/YefM family antitoxin component YafN of YafNO toxin-antitoxin module
MHTYNTMKFTEARKQFSTLHEHFDKDNNAIIVEKHGQRLLAIVDPDYLDAMVETMEIMADPNTYKMLLESLDDIKHGRVRSHEDVRRDILGD